MPAVSTKHLCGLHRKSGLEKAVSALVALGLGHSMGKAVCSRQARPWAEQLLQYLSTWIGSWVCIQNLFSSCRSARFNPPACGEYLTSAELKEYKEEKLRCWGRRWLQLQTRYLVSDGEKNRVAISLSDLLSDTNIRGDILHNLNNP